MTLISNSSRGYKPSVLILNFPSSRVCRAVRVEPERDGEAWIVIANAVGNIFGDYEDAMREAREIASTLGLTVRSTAGVVSC
jgi:hypothetical protein